MQTDDVVLYATTPKISAEVVDPSRQLLEYLVTALEKHPDLAARAKIALTEKR